MRRELPELAGPEALEQVEPAGRPAGNGDAVGTEHRHVDRGAP